MCGGGEMRSYVDLLKVTRHELENLQKNHENHFQKPSLLDFYFDFLKSFDISKFCKYAAFGMVRDRDNCHFFSSSCYYHCYVSPQ